MTINVKILATAVLSTEATIYTVPSACVTRVEHLVISNGSTAGTITVKITDTSASVTRLLLNAVPITANGTIEFFNFVLETGDILLASAATTTNANILLFGAENV
jgi:hypothetical protein